MREITLLTVWVSWIWICQHWMVDFEQIDIEHRESLNNSFLVCVNLTLVKRTLERNILSVQKYMLRFLNCTMKIGHIITIKGHCNLRIKVIPVCMSCQVMAELSFINLIDINIKLWKTIYKLLQPLLTYLELCRECNRWHCEPYYPKLE